MLKWTRLACWLPLLGLAGPVLAESEQRLRVYNWTDYIAPNTIAAFEAATGITVEYETYDSNEAVEARLLAGHSGYDVVVPSAIPTLARLIAAGAVQKLDKTKIPNLVKLDPQVMETLRTADPYLDYSAIYLWGTNGLGINVPEVQKRLGADTPLDSWDLLFKPELLSKLEDCGVAVLDIAEDAMMVATHYLGYDYRVEDPVALRAAERLWSQAARHVRYFHSSHYADDLAQGDLCLVLGFSGDILQARATAEEAGHGVDIHFVNPREGNTLWIDTMAIPAGAANPEAAHMFINYILNEAVIADISNYVYYAHAVPSALPLTDPTITADPAIFPPAEVRAKLLPSIIYSARHQRSIARAWARVRTGR